MGRSCVEWAMVVSDCFFAGFVLAVFLWGDGGLWWRGCVWGCWWFVVCWFLVEKKTMSACFYVHTVAVSAWLHAGGVEENALTTRKQTQKNNATKQ